jgi:hypothetical protein
MLLVQLWELVLEVVGLFQVHLRHRHYHHQLVQIHLDLEECHQLQLRLLLQLKHMHLEVFVDGASQILLVVLFLVVHHRQEILMHMALHHQVIMGMVLCHHTTDIRRVVLHIPEDGILHNPISTKDEVEEEPQVVGHMMMPTMEVEVDLIVATQVVSVTFREDHRRPHLDPLNRITTIRMDAAEEEAHLHLLEGHRLHAEVEGSHRWVHHRLRIIMSTMMVDMVIIIIHPHQVHADLLMIIYRHGSKHR